MKKEYNISGLDCGYCALTLEKYLEKIDGVKTCNVNFSTSKIFLDIEDDKVKLTIKEIFKVTKQVNPDVKISENKDVDNKLKLYDIILYIIGLIVGVCVVFVDMHIVPYYILLVLSKSFLTVSVG